MHWFLGLLGLLLAACAAPSPHFKASPATRIVVDQTVFDVRVRGELAEAVRRNAQYAPRFGPLRAQAGFAMAQVSGCKVLTVTGDQAVALGTLDCDGQPLAYEVRGDGEDALANPDFIAEGAMAG